PTVDQWTIRDILHCSSACSTGCLIEYPDPAYSSLMATRVEARLLEELAEQQQMRLARRAIRWLQSLDRQSMMSPSDNGLRNVWDEVCVQCQFQQSIYWDVYMTAILEAIEHDLATVDPTIRAAMWLQTAPGVSWLERAFHSEEQGVRVHDVPWFDPDIAEWITDAILAEAGKWSNPRIRRCLEQESYVD